MIERLQIENPKRSAKDRAGSSSWYPYYAGFSTYFAHSLLSSSRIGNDSVVVDTWNGSGTTTRIASALGYPTYGYDLNPVMVVAAKARLLSKGEAPSLWPIASNILKKAKHGVVVGEGTDPLETWLTAPSLGHFRSLERAVQLLLYDASGYRLLCERDNLLSLSDLASFYYVALFRALRSVLTPFSASNPTWIRKPMNPNAKLRPTRDTIFEAFSLAVKSMTVGLEEDWLAEGNRKTYISPSASESVPLDDESADFVLSSPPYCTRIDYAVATMPELALLGYHPDGSLDALRRRLIGTSTVPTSVDIPSTSWGNLCNDFLRRVSEHQSKASRTYYYKNHVQYFDAIYRSLKELRRILSSRGICVLVVQDSFYKDIYNDLPQIFVEMANSNHMRLARRVDFRNKSMARINPAVRPYRRPSSAIESVLCFVRE